MLSPIYMIRSQYRHIFGVRSDVNSNIWFADETLVAYVAGHNLIFYNIIDKSQKFLPGSENSEAITALALCSGRKYAAIAEKGDRAHITIYDLRTLRKKKNLHHVESAAHEYVCVAFSPDDEMLLALTGYPDWSLQVWSWKKAKVMSSLSLLEEESTSKILGCSYSPIDPSLVAVHGDSMFRFFRVTESSEIRPMAQARLPPANYSCHSWLKVPEDHLVLGTQSGELIVFGSGEYLCHVNTAPRYVAWIVNRLLVIMGSNWLNMYLVT